MKARITPATLKWAERTALWLIVAIVAATVIATLATSRQSLAQNLAATPWHAVGWLLAATVVENLLRFWRYPVAFKGLGLKVPMRPLTFYYVAGFGLIPTPGKLGIAIRLWFLKNNHNLPYKRTAPVLIMDFIADAIGICALTALACLLAADPRFKAVGLLTGAGLVGGIAATLLAPRFMGRILRILYALTGRRAPRLFARMLMLIRTVSKVLGWKVLAVTSFLSFAGWGLVGVAIGTLMQGFGMPAGNSLNGVLVIALSNIGGFVSMMPAGVGGAEVSMTAMFAAFGAPLALAVLATAIVRTVTLWLSVLLGLVVLPVALRRTRAAA